VFFCDRLGFEINKQGEDDVHIKIQNNNLQGS
jgi:hypothetical protein